MANVSYDEKGKLYVIKDNDNIYEMDVSIEINNDLRRQASVTTLTDEDIKMLYKYAQLKYGLVHDKKQFVDVSLKNLFPGLGINEIMIIAYDHINNKNTQVQCLQYKHTNIIYFIIITLFFVNLFLLFIYKKNL